jgi:hypothetical protein
MIDWLRHILHRAGGWEVLAQGPRIDEDGSVIGRYYDCRCKKCGYIKEFRT